VKDGIDAVEGFGYCFGIADVTGVELDFGVEVIGTAAVIAVYLRIQIVKDADSVTALK
jgi:hypothetical protein